MNEEPEFVNAAPKKKAENIISIRVSPAFYEKVTALQIKLGFSTKPALCEGLLRASMIEAQILPRTADTAYLVRKFQRTVEPEKVF